jgi:RHS repeat-associated protein
MMLSAVIQTEQNVPVMMNKIANCTNLGSTTASTNKSGTIIESASYDSFGNATGNLSTRYGYTGREFDADLGLQYSRARWYDATVGRFISEDPIGFAGGDVNLYGYVGNKPIKYFDPLGLQASCGDQDDSCSKDRLDMWHAMYKLTQQWNDEGKRHPIYQYNGISGTAGLLTQAVGYGLNLIYATEAGKIAENARVYMACTDQAQGLLQKLGEMNRSNKFGNWWTFRLEFLHQTPIGALHTRVKVISVNSKCKSFWIDPWKGKIETF